MTQHLLILLRNRYVTDAPFIAQGPCNAVTVRMYWPSNEIDPRPIGEWDFETSSQQKVRLSVFIHFQLINLLYLYEFSSEVRYFWHVNHDANR